MMPPEVPYTFFAQPKLNHVLVLLFAGVFFETPFTLVQRETKRKATICVAPHFDTSHTRLLKPTLACQAAHNRQGTGLQASSDDKGRPVAEGINQLSACQVSFGHSWANLDQ